MIRYLLFLSILIPSSSFAKCVSEFHVISGSITKGASPLSNAQITVSFIDGLKSQIDRTGTSDDIGAYKIEFSYSTYSGSKVFGPEKCKFVLDQLQLKIEVDGLDDKFIDKITVLGNETTYNKAFNVMDAANRGAH